MARVVEGVVGDVGGTNARFALARVEDGVVRLSRHVALRAADYPAGVDAARTFLERIGGLGRPARAVIAAAGPVEDGAVAFTNHEGWRFSERELAGACGFSAVRLINDFTAQALAIDRFRPQDLRRIGPAGEPDPAATAAILGPGTGFGAAARVGGGGRAILSGEGGHAGLSPGDEVESEIVRRLMLEFGRVSVERVVSGPGLLNLCRVLAGMRGEPASYERPDQVTAAALEGVPLARAALDRFCAFLGSVAGDFALAYGARGGVYIAGGVALGVLDFLAASDFRRRFEDKGRMSGYLKRIPTYVVIAPDAALLGAASRLADLEAG